MEPPFFGEPGSGYLLGPWSRGHEFAFRHHDVGSFRARGLGRDDRLFHRHRFVTDFRFFQFAYPYDWYPDYDYGYPHDYSYYDYSPVFGNGLATRLNSTSLTRIVSKPSLELLQTPLDGEDRFFGVLSGWLDSGICCNRKRHILSSVLIQSASLSRQVPANYSVRSRI